jgi:hypothetical protein
VPSRGATSRRPNVDTRGVHASGVPAVDLPGIDELLPARVRETLEERYWRPIQEAAVLERFADDSAFIADPVNHIALFSDHGVVHVRDVAAGVHSLAATVNGVLLPGRPPERQAFLAGYGVLAAYIHDIGMHDQTRVGRRLHPVYAAHVAYDSGLDDVVAELLGSDGPVVRRLRAVQVEAPFICPLDVVLRELLALSMAHSKSAVPAPLLDDPPRLRRLAQCAVLTDFDTHRARGSLPGADEDPELTANTSCYVDPLDTSFAWLVSEAPAQRSLVDDVVDALRVLRAADALRQRGTSLKTTAGYEIFIDAGSGEAVFALRAADNSKVYLLKGDSPKSAGEANLRVATVTQKGNLRFVFHRGAYLGPEANRYAVESTAHVLADIVDDVVWSFSSGRVPQDLDAPAVSSDEIQIQLERPGDNPAFAEEVAGLLAIASPELAARIVTVADLEGVPKAERERYHRGVAVDPRSGEARHVLEQLGRHGAKVEGIDIDAAFVDVRRVRVSAGEVVSTIGAAPRFVYVATGPGLQVQPGGGYAAASVTAWVPVGTTGVIRRAERNAEITVDRDVDVLMIPAECYVREWFRPYTAEEIVAVLGGTNQP